MATWIARNSDSAWMVRGFGDSTLINSQPASYTAVDVPNGCPNPRLERYDSASVSKTRAATAAEVAAFDQQDADRLTAAGLTNPELLAVIAWAARALNVSPTQAIIGVRQELKQLHRKAKE